MTDEPTTVETPQEPGAVVETTPEPVVTPAETPAPAATTPEVTPAAPTLEEQLAKLDPKEFRRLMRQDSRLSGVLGREIHEAIEADRTRQQEEGNKRVREQTEAELLKFADDNAEYMREHYPKAYQRLEDLKSEQNKRTNDALTNEIKGRTVHELATSIGQAIHDVPEWQELTPADHEAIAKELMGIPEERVIATFNRLVVSAVADRRAKRLHSEWKSKDLSSELAKEREALRQEEAAKLLRGSDAPDTAKSKGQPAGGTNIKSMTDVEFDRYWDTK